MKFYAKLEFKYFEKIACSISIDLTPVPGDCTKFYRCGSNVLFIYSCPVGTYFNTATKNCAAGTLANCNGAIPQG